MPEDPGRESRPEDRSEGSQPEPGEWLRKSHDESLNVAERAELEVQKEDLAAETKTQWIKRAFWAVIALVLGGVIVTLVI